MPGRRAESVGGCSTRRAGRSSPKTREMMLRKASTPRELMIMIPTSRGGTVQLAFAKAIKAAVQ
jgi:hypothetical protein